MVIVIVRSREGALNGVMVVLTYNSGWYCSVILIGDEGSLAPPMT